MQSAHVFALVVEGIDEFTTADDWNRIWQDRVKPQQQSFWEARGQRPQGRRGPDLERLRNALPLYKAWLSTGVHGHRSVGAALDHLQRKGTAWEDKDIGTARRVVNTLDDLFQPR